MSERGEGSRERLEEELLGKKDYEVSLEHLRTMAPIRHERALVSAGVQGRVQGAMPLEGELR